MAFYLVLPTDVPHSERNILVLDSLNIKAYNVATFFLAKSLEFWNVPLFSTPESGRGKVAGRKGNP